MSVNCPFEVGERYNLIHFFLDFLVTSFLVDTEIWGNMEHDELGMI
ncbi:MAG: hypothetical protein ACWA44_04705 [Thiotrichales bacterium]